MPNDVPENDTLEAALQFAAGLVNAPIISEMADRAGVYRSIPAIGNDAAAGLIRMVIVAGHYRLTTLEEAERYVAWLVERHIAKPLKRRRPTSVREFVDQLQDVRAA